MSLPKYEKYKNSGVQWLGEIPEGWQVGRLKHSVLFSKGGVWGAEPVGDEEDIICVRVADFDRTKLRVRLENPTFRNVVKSERNGRVLVRGDLLLEKSGGGEKQLVGCVVLYSHDEPAVCSNFITRLRLASGMVPEYWCYLHFLLHASRLNYCSINQTSGIQNLDQDKYLNELVPFPDFNEQSAIVNFLDGETAKIDNLVAEQEKLLVLLAEKRQATVSHFVTRGVNSAAQLKDSGVTWMGKIPAHWEVCQSRRMFAVRSEPALPSDKMLTASQKYGVLFQTDYVELEGRRVVEVIKGVESLKHVEPDDFIISMRSFQGGIEWCSLSGSTSFHYVMIKPIKNVYPPYFAHLFKSLTYIQALRSTTDLIRDGQELRYSNFVQVGLPVAPLDEQRKIAMVIDEEVLKLDKLAVEAGNIIELLKERRKALVLAAVTGKIDVRGMGTAQARQEMLVA